MQLNKIAARPITHVFLLILFFNANALGQFEVLPCDDPDNNGVGCYCETAGILCTPDLLDGFEFAMSDTENFGDLGDGIGGDPDDLCPPSGNGDGGVPNNVNFFAFIVWCETLTFDVLVTNCEDNPLDGFVTYGIQMALFANCPAANGGTWDAVECITNGGETCFNTEAAVPPLQTFSASGLEIGATYYFMVDGCALSTCKVTINVQGTCGNGEITPWDNGIFGAQTVCVGDTETYVAEDIAVGLDGAEEYYYYLDGVLIDEGEEIYEIDVTWDTPGTYELCVDVSNLPCIPESDDPAQSCVTVVVNGPGNGDIQADPEVLCPDEISTITVNEGNIDPANTEYIIIVDATGAVVQIDQALTTAFTHDLCAGFTAYYYSFVTADNPPIPMVGDIWTLPDCLADCCSLDEVEITFEDTEDPEFTNPPVDETLDCAEDVMDGEELTWTDNCAGTGTVEPTVVENFTLCDGGTLERTWTFTDSCSNEVTHTQTITIEQVPEAEFILPPGDSIIDCDIAQIFAPVDLNYSNMGTGACDISGTVSPTSMGTFDLCGSSVTYTWEYTDICNRTITHSQVVTVQEVGAANDFIDPPDDITITCLEWLTFTPATLSFTNNLNGPCEISGMVDATTTDVHDPCGSAITFNWEYTDVCGRTITHSQVVTVEPTLEAAFINPPADATINCDELQTFVPATLMYSNAGTGSCLIEGMLDPTGDGMLDTCGNSVTYTWEFTDDCNRTITHSQTVTVEPIPEAVFINPPGNVSIDCNELQSFVPATLAYSNGQTGNCLIEGTVDPTSDGMLDTCGNSVTYTWDFTDQCGRAITHSQIVTVDPIPEASFVNPPGNTTITCNDLQTFMPEILTYTNGGVGNCLIEGTVDPVGDGELDTCGNSVTYTWEFTDQCGRIISHSQTVTVEPIPEASFVNPPGDLTINCNELQTFTPEILNYTNGEFGNCLIEGMIDPVGDGELDTCGNSVTYTWEFTDQCGRTISHSQTVTVEPIPEASFVNPPGNLTINCDELQTFTPEILNYTNGEFGNCLIEGMIDPVGDGELDTCGNSVTYIWEFTDQCGRTISHSQTVTVEPIPEASFVNPPGNLTINCDELQTFTPEVLSFTNGEVGNCLIEGMIDPVGDGELDTCGNSVTYTWEFTDQCGRTISHSQTVTVEPIPEAAFVNPPGNLTINCDQLQSFSPVALTYTNNGMGNCLIEGTIDPVGDGELDTCGNSVTYTWEFTDQCGRSISHSQTVTVEPIPEASFIDPPGNVTINCDELQTFTPTTLSYTNSGSGSCLIEGSVDPVGDGELDECGNSVNYTWEFTDQCGRTITHTQTVTVEPIPEASFVDPPGDISFNCDELQSFTPAVLSYTNGGVGDCLIEGTVDPVGDGELDICGNMVTYTWEFTDQCGRTISHSQTVTAEPIAPPDFIDPPVDETVSCDVKPDQGDGSSLSYTNGGTDDCEIAGEVAPVEDYNVNECGGEIIYTWEFTDDCGITITHTQTIVVEPAPQAQFDDLPSSSVTIPCSENTDMGPTLTVTNNEDGDCLIEEEVAPSKIGDADICGGSFEFLWEFTDECGRTTSFTQTVNVDPAPQANFDNLPDEIDISCSENGDAPEDLTYSNGETGDCAISGTVAGVRSGVIDYCGGVLTDTWEFTDECGRIISTERDVNVEPAPAAEYINPPSDITVNCDEVDIVPGILTYNNGEGGLCQISGTSIAVVSGTFDQCGGALIYTWSFVDDCGRAISHSQNIVVNPAPDPQFVNPPEDEVIDCEDIYPGPPNLNYTNGQTDVCEISGVVFPTSDQVDNVITNTWEFTHPCTGELIIHIQTVTLSIVPDITVVPSTLFLCQGDSYDLTEVVVDELNGTNITVTYHNAFPPTPGNEISSIVNPTSDFIYVVNAVNEFGCEDFELVNIFVEIPPFAGDDQFTTVCSDGFPLNLFDFIPPFADQTGSWLDIDGIGANISNPFGATFNNVPPGNYSLYYVAFSTNVCDNDTMVLDIEVIEDVSFEITDVTCIAPNDFYEVYLNANGFTIQSTEGDVVNISGDEYVITNIPITTGVFITAFELISGCSATEFIDIPNCDCPDIDPPTSDDISICVNDQPVILSVNVPAGMTANWFLEQGANTAFLEGSMEFTLQDSSAGIYSFYVETYDPATDCTSNVKLEINVEINDLPMVMDPTITICDLENDGQEEVSLQTFNSFVNVSPANTFTYYATLSDAEMDVNPLADDFDLSLGSNIVFVRVVNSADCVAFAEMELILNDLPEADVNVTAPTCIDISDGQISITPTDVDGTMTTSLDGVNFDETTFYNGLSSGDYTVFIQDENNCVNTYEVEVSDGLDIFFTQFTAQCDDNGTDTDPTDDFYVVSLLIENNLNNEGSYHVIFNGSVQFTFTYGANESFTIPVDEGNTIEISIADVLFLCTKEQTFGPLNPCSTNCEVSIDLLEPVCNDNGTDTDPSDDFYTVTINSSSMNGSSNNTYNVFIGGVLLYNFTYGVDETFDLAANSENVTITCQDNEDVQCQTSVEIGPLNPCSGGCQIELEILAEDCDNNGTATIQDDDFYTFSIQGNILNGDDLTQFELFVDGVSQGTFNYGEEVNFNSDADGMTHDISIEDISNSGCGDGYTTANLEDCSTDCEVSINSIEDSCSDNGTPQDPTDDFYEFTINASSVNGAANGLYNLYIDDQFDGAYAYDTDIMITINADGQVHDIRLQDSEELACELEVSTAALTPCSDACLIDLVIVDSECFDNGTATNIDDDFYEFDLRGVLLNGDNNAQFELFIDGVSEGTFSYDELVNVTISADNQVHTIQIIDTTDPSCVFELDTEVLVSCSTDCEINIDFLDSECFDNGTPTDPSDDFIELSINISAVNGSTTEMFNFYVNGVLEGIYMYGNLQVITLPAQDQTVTLRFQDSQDLQCEVDIDTDLFAPCSNGCLIDLNIVAFECFDNNTPTDVNDDFYEYIIQGEVLNGMPSSGFEVFVDGTSVGTSDYGENYTVTLPADGDIHIIEIVDLDDSACTSTFSTSNLTSCSTDCEISIDNLVFNCSDNGTLDDPSDDFYEVTFTASAINGGSGFELTVGGNQIGIFNYGQEVNLEFDADGETLILVLEDLSDEQCKLNETVTTLNTCSDLCTIEPMILSSECLDNGTPIDPFDDFWEITLIVNPQNGETALDYELRVDGELDGIYPYGETIVITIPADELTHLISVNDVDDVNCDATVNTEQLDYCSTPCEVTASYDNVSCDNNGTNDTSADDLYFVDLTVMNPEDGQFEIPGYSISGNFNETITIGPFLISDGNLELEIFDVAQNLCFITVELIPPSPCSDCEQTVDAGMGGTISCENTEIILTGSSSEVGDYEWYGPAGNLVSEELTATAVSIGTYTFRVTYPDGCIVEDDVEVQADTDLPVAILTSDGDITCEKLISILDGTASGSSDDFFFYWFDENENLVSEDPIFETDMPGVYFLQVESKSNNCRSALEAIIVNEFVNEPTAIIYAEPSNVIDCVIETIVLSTEQEENVNYIWSFNGNTIDAVMELEISEIGTYGLIAIDTITGCSGNADLLITSLVDYPNISLEAPEQLNCDNAEILIAATTFHTSDSFTSYWQDESQNIILENQDSLVVSEPGIYSYTLIDNNNGCENKDSILIELFETEVEIVTTPDVTYTEGQSVRLTATVNIETSQIESIQWTPDENMSCPTCLITSISNPTDSLYTITVIDVNGCLDTAQVRLIRKERPEVFIPNVINPGSNSGNDRFTIFANEEVELVLTMSVYDRWGNLIYTSQNVEPNDLGAGWDGTFNGENVEQGVYVYMLEVLLANGDRESFFGDLTVIW
ncbi:MAG: gliding motility-associated C-terminal domain-containing protein [Bacteroidota bacterium]